VRRGRTPNLPMWSANRTEMPDATAETVAKIAEKSLRWVGLHCCVPYPIRRRYRIQLRYVGGPRDAVHTAVDQVARPVAKVSLKWSPRGIPRPNAPSLCDTHGSHLAPEKALQRTRPKNPG